MLALLVFAAFAGNTVNYAVGRFIGPRVFQSSHPAAEQGLSRPGARVSSSATAARRSSSAASCPSCARSCRSWPARRRMTTASFASYNLIGAVAWVSLCLGAAGSSATFRSSRTISRWSPSGIVFVSVLPMVFELIGRRRKAGPSDLVTLGGPFQIRRNYSPRRRRGTRHVDGCSARSRTSSAGSPGTHRLDDNLTFRLALDLSLPSISGDHRSVDVHARRQTFVDERPRELIRARVVGHRSEDENEIAHVRSCTLFGVVVLCITSAADFRRAACARTSYAEIETPESQTTPSSTCC